MALFEKSLQAVATLDSVLTTANETFKAEQKKLLATLKDPTKQIGEMRKALTETEAEQKRIFRETVQADFAAVRDKVNAVVTAAPPADFLATLEAIKANGKNITDYEAAAYMEKYKGNYFAFRTLHEVLTAAGKKLDSFVMKPDGISEEMNKGEQMLLNWGREWKGSNYMGALLQHHTNPITHLAEQVQKFIEGRFIVEDE